jgi:hypothetical protein
MKKYILLMFLWTLSMSQTLAQSVQAPIILQSGSSIRAFASLDSAVLAAVDNDVITMPGGTFQLTRPINKKLFIYGNGYRPDTAGVASTTTVTASGNVVFSGRNVQDTYVSGIDFIKQV